MSRPYPEVEQVGMFDALNMLMAIGPNLLNQVNRIGGQDVPLYDQEVGYDDAFRNTGAYPEWANQLVGLLAGVAEPGPGEAAQLGRLLADSPAALAVLGPLIRTGKPIRSFSTPSATTTGTVPTGRISELPGFADEDLAIYRTGNPMDDPRTAELAAHLEDVGPGGMRPIEVSVYPEGWRPPNPDRVSSAYVKDGNHRAAVAAQLGWEEVPVQVTYHGGAEDGVDMFMDLINRLGGGGGGR